jgi:hypothetical protein
MKYVWMAASWFLIVALMGCSTVGMTRHPVLVCVPAKAGDAQVILCLDADDYKALHQGEGDASGK